MTDVDTPRVRLQDPARETGVLVDADFFQQVIQHGIVPYLVWQDGRIVYANAAALEVMGLPAETPPASLDLFSFYAPGERDEGLANLHRILESGLSTGHVRRRVFDRGGRPRVILGFASAAVRDDRPALVLSFVVVGEWDPATGEERPAGAGDPSGTALRAGLQSLSPRQRQIALLLAQGFDTGHVASMLGIAESTVRSHTKEVYGRLAVRSRIELARRIAEI
jgi:DNA-binding CsgD family transcriptional regulator